MTCVSPRCLHIIEESILLKERVLYVENIGLVLEGGGMRGVYTAGVLEFFLEHDLMFPYVIGVSAGACIAASYLSRQKGRNRKVNIDFADHPKYISYKNLIKNKELFGMDFIFDEIPNQLVPFDYDTFHKGTERFLIGTTDCMTGEPVYFEKTMYPDDILYLLRASSSLPFMAPMIKYKGYHLLDGGISDSIPIIKSQSDGNVKNVVVLTRNKGYRKKPGKFNWLLKRAYKNYPGLVKAMTERYLNYNRTLEYLEEEEKAGRIFIIRPSEPLQVGRVEKNKDKLTELYNQGYHDADKLFHDLKQWLDISETLTINS